MKPFVRLLIVTEDWLSANVRGGFLRWKKQPSPAAHIPGQTREFYLGEFTRVLNSTVWVGFDLEITKAHRAAPGTQGMDEAALKADRGCDIVNFRFDQPFTVNGQRRVLADYDIALYFAMDSREPNPALAPEAEAIARFMESGKGFFATGDHENIGAELCGLIPRVRSMRRWRYATSTPDSPQAPPGSGPDRLDTTRPGEDNVVNFEDQSDEVPQEIIPTMYPAGAQGGSGWSVATALPHPLLCSPMGIVRYLPDHMHEGMCEVPGNLAARTFTLGGTARREYPDYTPPGMPSGYVPKPLAPEIVATSRVIAGFTTPALDPVHPGDSIPTAGRSFGAIAAWDGYRVGKGRVVVDSTFHHFVDINLTGDRYLDDDPLGSAGLQKGAGFYLDITSGRETVDEYKMIMWYFRNIVYWLIPVAKQQTIWWQSLVELGGRSVVSEVITPQLRRSAQRLREQISNIQFEQYLYLGFLAESYFDQARGACSVAQLKQDLYFPTERLGLRIRKLLDVWEPVPEAGPPDSVRRGQLAGVHGTGPRPEILGPLGLGAALVTAAALRPTLENGVDSERAARLLQEAWPAVLGHAAGELRDALVHGLDVHNELQSLLEEVTAPRANAE